MTTQIQTVLAHEKIKVEVQRRPFNSMDEETYAVLIMCEPPAANYQKLILVLRRTQLADLWVAIGAAINRPTSDELEPPTPNDTERSNT